ncbi:TetR/AcrR family transcriptional regulator [Terrarubrum flagellatum]|uniref:TetR/AcrR family transcriptional regulator n=1 Tax=Terrirubrum flagellatum TaxID=2895980 RepID=UPI003144DF3C
MSDSPATAPAGRAKTTRVSRKALGRKPSKKSGATRSKILAAAAKVFASNGYQLTKLSDIAREVDIHVTALNYHFETKDHLVEEMMNALVHHVSESVQAGVAALPATATHRERILVGAVAFLQAILEQKDFITAHGHVLYQVPQEVRDRHFVHLAEANVFWRRLILEAWQKGELRRSLNPSLAMQMLMGTLIWTREWYRPGRDTPAEIATEIIDILFDGMGARPQK